jgi:hypothetical protein
MTGNVRQTAEEFGVSPSTVMKYRDEIDGFEQIRTYKKEQFIKDAWRNIAAGMSMLTDKFTAASAKDIGTTIGILVDKMQLLQGEATSRSENANRNVHSLDDISAEQARVLVEMWTKNNE